MLPVQCRIDAEWAGRQQVLRAGNSVVMMRSSSGRNQRCQFKTARRPNYMLWFGSLHAVDGTSLLVSASASFFLGKAKRPGVEGSRDIFGQKPKLPPIVAVLWPGVKPKSQEVAKVNPPVDYFNAATELKAPFLGLQLLCIAGKGRRQSTAENSTILSKLMLPSLS